MKNFWLDVILLVLFVAELNFHSLPKVLHEILGVVMAAAIILHIAWNRRRFISLTKKILPKKFLCLLINLDMFFMLALTIATGVCMSNFLFPDFVSPELRRNMTIHQLHLAAPYVLLILIGMHVGFHWLELRQRLLNFLGGEEIYQRHKKIFNAAIIFLSAMGVVGLYMNRVADRILMKHIFATPATDLPAVIFALMILGGIIFFAAMTKIFWRFANGR